MQGSSRLYGCFSCNSPIIICRHCDRGNRYCKQCAPVMYLKARRRANKRYQSTYRGRINHAVRQKRYRERQKQKVTHQCSKGQSVRDLVMNKRKCAMLTVEPTFRIFFGIQIIFPQLHSGQSTDASALDGKTVFTKYQDRQTCRLNSTVYSWLRLI